MSHISIASIVVIFIINLVMAAYEVDLTRFEILSESNPDYVDAKTFRVTKKSRNLFTLTGDFEMKINLGPETMFKAEFYQRTFTGKYMKMGSITERFCDLVKRDFYKRLSEASNVPYPPPCPYPKGTYTYNGLQIDESFFPNVLPLGENYVRGYLILNNEIILGFQMNTIIRPA